MLDKKIIRVNKLENFENIFSKTLELKSDFIQIPYGNEIILTNGLTETPGNFGSLGNIEDNIPFFFNLIKYLNIDKTKILFLKEILISNIYLTMYYFRNHILIKNIAQNKNISIVVDKISKHLNPIIDLHNFINKDNVALKNFISNKSSNLELIYAFEEIMTLLRDANNLKSNNYILSGKKTKSNFNKLLWKNKDEYQKYLAVINYIINKFRNYLYYIDSFILYGSLATGKINQNSDILDAIILLNNNVFNSRSKFNELFSTLVETNKYILDTHEIINKHTYHYLFSNELVSITPFYKNKFIKHSIVLFGNEIKQDANLDCSIFDSHFNKFMLINKYQKIVNFAVKSIKNNVQKKFLLELITHMKKSFFIHVISAINKQNIHEEKVEKIFFLHFYEFKELFNYLLDITSLPNSNIEINIRIEKIIDFYSEIISRIYFSENSRTSAIIT